MDWYVWFRQADPANLFVGLVAAVGLGFTVVSIRRQTRDSRLEKIADVLMDCTRRFENLVSLRYQLETSVAEKKLPAAQAARRYYTVYWNLQLDQFNYFLLGLLPREVLATWMMDRLALLQRGEEVLGTRFEDGWQNIGSRQMLNYSDFSSFVDTVWQLQDTSTDDAKAAIDDALKVQFQNNKAMRKSYR